MTLISILAVAVVGSWTYAGFLVQPSPKPAPTPPPPKPASAPIDPAREPIPKPSEAHTESTIPNPAPATKPPASSKSTRHRLTDSSGQTWEHADPVYLADFVDALNRARTNSKNRP
jgi:hypothetical protein